MLPLQHSSPRGAQQALATFAPAPVHQCQPVKPIIAIRLPIASAGGWSLIDSRLIDYPELTAPSPIPQRMTPSQAPAIGLRSRQ